MCVMGQHIEQHSQPKRFIAVDISMRPPLQGENDDITSDRDRTNRISAPSSLLISPVAIMRPGIMMIRMLRTARVPPGVISMEFLAQTSPLISPRLDAHCFGHKAPKRPLILPALSSPLPLEDTQNQREATLERKLGEAVLEAPEVVVSEDIDDSGIESGVIDSIERVLVQQFSIRDVVFRNDS